MGGRLLDRAGERHRSGWSEIDIGRYGFLGGFRSFLHFFFLLVWVWRLHSDKMLFSFSFVLISRLNGRTIISNLGSIYTMHTVVNFDYGYLKVGGDLVARYERVYNPSL